ncbi:MAG TPA: hypothetical protein VIY26_01390 [Acidimicrobiales bacterium]
MAVGGLAAGAVSGSAGAAATAKEKAQAKSALVSLTDLPHGWTASPLPSTSASGTGFTGGPELARCLGVPTKLVTSNPPKELSPLYSNPGGSELVQDTISIYPSAAYAHAVFAAVSSHKSAGCIAAELNSAGATSASDRATVTRVTSPKGTAAFTLDATVTGEGSKPTPTSTEIVYFVHGQYGTGLDVETSGMTPPTALTAQLLSVARARS